jgi:NAD(P)-dependent dehydrogenase (short-subunit alcohol dehydrogenase family)
LIGGKNLATRYDCFGGKVAVVMGGAEGIGRACALAFVQQGAKVVVADLRPEVETDLSEAAVGAEGSIHYVQANATLPEDVARVAAAAEELGELKTVVNCVGGFPSARPFLELTAEEWDLGVRVNLYSAFYSCQTFAKIMKARGGGSIVNLSSLAARNAATVSPVYYVAAKSGVEGMTRLLAYELGRYGIRVNSVAPGTTITNRVKRVYNNEQLAARGATSARGVLAQPEEIASTVLFLASDEAVHVTGATLFVNGGLAIFA